MFHGNGGNLGHRIPLAGIFFKRMRCNVLMMCYRGCVFSMISISSLNAKQVWTLGGHAVGKRCACTLASLVSISHGITGLQIDAQTGLDYLMSHPTLKQTKIILYGQSIGGAVAIDLASKNADKITALILENTFTSLPSLVPHALPALGPFAFLCHQKWDSASKIPLIPPTTPMLMLSGSRDELVPREHMRALWEAVARRGEKKTAGGGEYKVGLERARYVEFEGGGHSAFFHILF